LCAGLLSGCGSKSSSSDTAASSTAAAAKSSMSHAPSVTYSQDGDMQATERDTRGEKADQAQSSEEYSDTYFRDYGVNPFVQAGEEPLSTFSMDVDTASYTIARKYINDGSLPPQDAIRPEEFINYFKRQYPQPSNATFSIYTEMAPSAFNRGYHVLEVGLQGKNVGTAEMKNSALTFVIDVSGSMDMDNRLTLVKKSLKILVDQMGENDKIGIVVYGTTGRKLLEPTNGSNKNRIMDAINELEPEGSTNAAEGLMLGYEMASEANIKGGNNRIILCTDGVANQGITKAEEILKMVEDYKSKGITLTTLGFGMDNYNDIFLETLADKGDGNYSYIGTIDEAKKVFIDQLTGTLQVIAKDAKSQIEFNTDSVECYRLIGYENRKLDSDDFRNNSVDAGEVGAGHAVTALYEIKLKSSVSDNIGTVRIRFKNPDTNKVSEESKQIKASQIWSNFYDATPRFRFITMVAQTAEILKGSPWASNTDLQDVYSILKNNIKDLRMNNEDDQFVDMVKKAIDIKAR
jgi:Ca-activated chloride channel family protein